MKQAEREKANLEKEKINQTKQEPKEVDQESSNMYKVPSEPIIEQRDPTKELITIVSIEGVQIQAPKKLTLMCKKINSPVFQTNINQDNLRKILEYCKSKHYQKQSALPFPLTMNNLKDNPKIVEADIKLFENILDDFYQLKEMMRSAKEMGCEALY